jgi:hypothetical protein
MSREIKINEMEKTLQLEDQNPLNLDESFYKSFIENKNNEEGGITLYYNNSSIYESEMEKIWFYIDENGEADKNGIVVQGSGEGNVSAVAIYGDFKASVA